MKHRIMTFFIGLLCGAALFGGATAIAAGITAQPAWSPIYVDGQQVQMTAYNILGNNYVKLRDIGQAVGFNVYYQDGVQVDSDAPYTGVAPASTASQPPAATAQTASTDAVRISLYKEGPLAVGDGSGLIISPSGTSYTVTSSNPAVATVEKVLGEFWKVNAVKAGTAVITATAPDGRSGSVQVAVTQSETTEQSIDLSANMDVRQEMIRLINETRRKNGVAALTVNDALMNAAQDCAAQGFTTHHSQYECETAMAYGYPHGFGSNLTAFTGAALSAVPRQAVQNWIDSPGHFQAMVDERCDTIGVGVFQDGGWTYCYMFAGDPNSHHPYE